MMRRISPKIILDFVWVFGWMLYILLGVPQTPFHGDEATLIYTSLDYAHQFIDRDLSRVTENSGGDPMDLELRLLDGRVHKYFSGLLWHLAGYTAADINQSWDWGGDLEYNRTTGHMPSPGLLITTRYAAAIVMAAGAAAIFGIGMRLDGRITAYVAIALYALHPALLLNGRRSMMEGSLMGFSLLTVLAGLVFVRYPRSALLLGLSAGMALSSKHTAILTVSLIFGAIGLYALRYKIRWILLLFVAAITAVLIFYAFNPPWWGHPVERMREVLALRSTLLMGQTSAFSNYAGLQDQLSGFWHYAVIGNAQYFEHPLWTNFITDQIQAYESSIWRGISLGGSLPGLLAFIGLAVLGIYRLVFGIRERGLERWVVGVWIFGIILLVIVLTPLGWQRYYLPAIPALCLLVALGCGMLKK